MYGNTPEAADARTALTLEVLQRHVGPCREWGEEKANICGAPSEYVLWGKRIPAEGLGPRCYDHAEKHIGHHGLGSLPGYAVINLDDLARDIDKAHFPLGHRV